MVRFKWKVTENIHDYNFTFDPKTEDLLIYGFIQLDLNGAKWGEYFDDVKTEKEIGVNLGDEDILLILDQFINEVALLKEGETNTLLVMQNNLDTLTMTRMGDNLFFRQHHRDTGEEDWRIRIDFNEFVEETKRNIKLFVDYIKEENPSLLENESIIKLMKGIE